MVATQSSLKEAQRLHRNNRLGEAKAMYQQILKVAPLQADAWYGLGMLAWQVGVQEVAIEMLAKAVALMPDAAEFRIQYAQALQDKGRIEQAAAQFQAACRLRPNDAALWGRLGIVQQALGDIGVAANSYRRAYELAPHPGVRLKLATLISPIIGSNEAMLSEREQVEEELDLLLADTSLRIDDPMQEALWTNFYLAFHGKNNRSLQIKYAALYGRICPSLNYVAPHSEQPRQVAEKIRVGLLSKYLCIHSIGRTSRGLFAGLSREKFEVTAIFVAPVTDDDYSRFIRQHADRSLVVPENLAEARRLIEELHLDVLFYQDIGMEPFSYFLAFSRLAPVQCVSFGHPDTTGIPAMDYFISNDLYESPAAQEHYSEQLFLLHDVGSLAYYYPPELKQPLKRRADFGLDEADHLYICPQNLFKFHPDMDEIIAGILRRDARGKLLVIEGRVGHWTDMMRRRWAAAMPDVMERIVFMPRLGSHDYVNLIALADVMLDTVHFNGMNTSLEALYVGTPVVTLPGELQRGRHTQAMYRKMGLADCIAGSAGHYVELAVRLGSDSAYRNATHQEILKRNSVLFQDIRVVREFERFFCEAVARLDRAHPFYAAPSIRAGAC
jgi:predicted O-linked N-acetylglucosamine transferase (SPINDLY family)